MFPTACKIQRSSLVVVITKSVRYIVVILILIADIEVYYIKYALQTSHQTKYIQMH